MAKAMKAMKAMKAQRARIKGIKWLREAVAVYEIFVAQAAVWKTRYFEFSKRGVAWR